MTLGGPGEVPGEFREQPEKISVADQGNVADFDMMDALLAALFAESNPAAPVGIVSVNVPEMSHSSKVPPPLAARVTA